MILTPHMLVGAAIGSKTKNYWAIFILAVVSHFYLDALPHWEYASRLAGVSNYEFLTTTLKSLADIVIGATIIYWLFKSSNRSLFVFFGALFALLPDGLVFLYFLLQTALGWNLTLLHSFYLFHNYLHFLERPDFLFWKIIGEGSVFFSALLFLFWQAGKNNYFPKLTAKLKSRLL